MLTRPRLSPAPLLARPRISVRAVTHLVIAAFAAGNLAYILSPSAPPLAPDEAHYWDWSRHLDWSYYSKGPLVAWLIRLGCLILGDTPAGVRVVAAGCNLLLLLAVERLATRHGGPRLGLLSITAAVTLPTVSAGAVLATIDGPFLCAWAWAAVWTIRAFDTHRVSDWWLAGGACTLGVLAKYPMVLFPVCVGAYMAADRMRWPLLRERGVWLLAAGTGVGLVPIAAWNAANGWPTVWHVAAQAGIKADGSTGFAPGGPVGFVAGQVGVLMGYWFAAWVWAIVRPHSNDRLLWWLSAPVVGVFAAASVLAKPQPNWPAAGYVTGLVLAAGVILRQIDGPPTKYRTCARVLLSGASVGGMLMCGVAHWPNLVRPTLAGLLPAPSSDRPAPVRQLDPTCRLAGWPTLAAAVDAARERVRHDTGTEPVVAAMTWGVPGELAFYGSGHPDTYSLGPALAGRLSQYDLWRPNPVADAQVFRGQSFVYVGEAIPDAAFGRAEPPVVVTATDGGVPVACWKVWVYHDFRGFPAAVGPVGR